MTPGEATRRFGELWRQGADEFAAAVAELRFEDSAGRWWQVDAGDGGWLVWNGDGWAKSSEPPDDRPSGEAVAVAAALTRCPSCGATGRPERKFCTGCGAALAGETQAASPLLPREGGVRISGGVIAGGAREVALPRASSGWGQRAWDVVTMAGCSGLSAAWYWYSGMAETRADYKTCLAIVVLPLALIVFRRWIDRVLLPLKAIRERIPRFALLGAGLALPYLISQYLYASGSSQFDYIFKTVVLSTLASHVVLRNPSLPGLSKLPRGLL